MEFAYTPEIWHGFFEVIALAAVTLTGLLSVAISINARHILDSPSHRAHGRGALIALTVLLALSMLVLIPAQGRVALGIELLVLSSVMLVVAVWLETRTLRRLHPRLRRSWTILLIGVSAAMLAIAIAGAGLVSRRVGGMLWLLPPVLIGLVWSTYIAWSLTLTAAEKHQDPT